MNILKPIACIVALLHVAQCLTTPATVFIVRHGEKTTEKQNVNFEQWHLVKSQPLDPRGWQRAYALAPHFAMQPDLLKYGKIVALFTPKPNKDYNSVRPIETITPLSKLINLPIYHDYGLEDACAFVEHIMTDTAYHNKTVLIAYEHHHIPGLGAVFQSYASSKGVDCSVPAPTTKANKKSTKTATKKPLVVPTTWNNNVFDRVWVLGFDVTSDELISFENKPQKLLFGDSVK